MFTETIVYLTLSTIDEVEKNVPSISQKDLEPLAMIMFDMSVAVENKDKNQVHSLLPNLTTELNSIKYKLPVITDGSMRELRRISFLKHQIELIVERIIFELHYNVERN